MIQNRLIGTNCSIEPIHGNESLVSALHLLVMDVDQSEQCYVVGGASIGVCMCGHQEPLQVFSNVTSLAQVRSTEE